MLVNFGALKLVKSGPKRRVIIWASVVSCALAIIVWVIYTIQTKPSSLFVFFTFLVLAVVFELLLQRIKKRKILPEFETSQS